EISREAFEALPDRIGRDQQIVEQRVGADRRALSELQRQVLHPPFTLGVLEDRGTRLRREERVGILYVTPLKAGRGEERIEVVAQLLESMEHAAHFAAVVGVGRCRNGESLRGASLDSQALVTIRRAPATSPASRGRR